MGLYINKDEHPSVYKSKNQINAPNQSYFQVNYFSEMIKEQKKINDALSKSYQTLNKLFQLQQGQQANQWEDVNRQLTDIKKDHVNRKEFERDVLNWLNRLQSRNMELQEMLENESGVQQDMNEQISGLAQSNEEILEQLRQYKSYTDELNSEMRDANEFKQQMSEQISNQKNAQDDMLNRLENQEALMEKTMRQMNDLRSIFYERTSHLVEKIEESYNMTSSYMYKLLTGSEQPLTLVVGNSKKRDEQKTMKE